ncbi:HD-GYP domain-containing protein [Clostridium ganghwense]|uniref:HD-GYP domain-containing protein n=1 Tax=Clostridium ganghwense TaxID=312089 RepID=A0ABT4CQW7_9CLOT|nr:HD-GYP domain-containing protein [Clostridium ganghwense]MCY6371450.1 HD-GYP domain-containing protein [Clostridium ganghwense]
MRAISVDNVKEGAILGKSIYSDSARLLLSKGIQLDKKLIETLKKHEIIYIYIEDHISEGIEINDVVDDVIRIKAISTMKRIFDMAMYQNRGKEKLDWIPFKLQKEVGDAIENILNNISENGNVLYSMTELMGTDMYTYKHSVNVAILSILTAKSLGIKKEQIKYIAMGGLLHDIGKIKIPPDILNKSEELTEEEINIINKHPKDGYEMVKQDISLSYITKDIIYSHHELLDGSGYPRGLKDDEISLYSKIITICDKFDSMTSDKINRAKIPIYKALEILTAQCHEKIDKDVYSKFVENIAVYPIGTGVLLEDGRKGIVMDIHRSCPDRPIIKIVEDEHCNEYYEIDLMKKLTVFIKDTIDLEEIKINF